MTKENKSRLIKLKFAAKVRRPFYIAVTTPLQSDFETILSYYPQKSFILR